MSIFVQAGFHKNSPKLDVYRYVRQESGRDVVLHAGISNLFGFKTFVSLRGVRDASIKIPCSVTTNVGMNPYNRDIPDKAYHYLVNTFFTVSNPRSRPQDYYETDLVLPMTCYRVEC